MPTLGVNPVADGGETEINKRIANLERKQRELINRLSYLFSNIDESNMPNVKICTYRGGALSFSLTGNTLTVYNNGTVAGTVTLT